MAYRKSYHNSRYHYSPYWRVWSRILGTLPNGDVVELDLEPIKNGNDTWEMISEVNIRRHSTAATENDKFQDWIDPDLLARMNANLGEGRTVYLLTMDFMSMIDWKKYDAVISGGVSLEDCVKEDSKRLALC